MFRKCARKWMNQQNKAAEAAAASEEAGPSEDGKKQEQGQPEEGFAVDYLKKIGESVAAMLDPFG